MPEFSSIGKILMTSGTVLFLIGGLLFLNVKISYLGHLPGDIAIQRKGYSFYFPVATCILLSIALSILLSFFSRR